MIKIISNLLPRESQMEYKRMSILQRFNYTWMDTTFPNNKGQSVLTCLRTTCQLVKMHIIWFAQPIREEVRTSLMCKFVIPHLQRLILIGLTNENSMIWANQIYGIRKPVVPRRLIKSLSTAMTYMLSCDIDVGKWHV